MASVVSKAVLQLIVLSILARYISAEEFGVVAITLMVMGFVKLLAEGGVGAAIIQHKDLQVEHIRSAFWLTMVLGVLFAGLIWVSAPFVIRFFRIPEALNIVRFSGAVFLVNAVGSIAVSLLSRAMAFKQLFRIKLASFIVGYGIVGVMCAIQGFGAWAILIALFVQGAIRSVLVFLIKPHSIKPAFTVKALKEVLHFGGGLVLARVFQYSASRADYIVIGRLFGPSPLGLYERAFQIIQLPADYVGNVLGRVLFPAFSIIQEQKEKLRVVFYQAVSTVYIVLMPSMLMLIVLAPEVVGIILGPKWTDTIRPLQILLLSVPFRAAIRMADSVVKATGAVYRNAWRKFLYMSAVAAGSLIGQFWGISGVAMGVVVAVWFHTLIMGRLSFDIVGGGWLDYARTLRSGCILSLIIVPIGWGLTLLGRQLISIDAIVFLGVYAIITVIAMGLIYWQPRILGRDGLLTAIQVLGILPKGEYLIDHFKRALVVDH